MITKLSKFYALSWSERKVLLMAALLLPIVWIGLRVLGLPRLQAWLDHSPVSARPSPSMEEIAAIGTVVRIAGNHVPGPSTCLTRSLFLGWLLRRRGLRSELRIGVRLNQGELEAHAWIEHDGRPIDDAADIAVQFSPFDQPISYKVFS